MVERVHGRVVSVAALMAVLVCSPLATLGVSQAAKSKAKPKGTKIAGSIAFERRNCAGDRSRTEVPLAGAPIYLFRPGGEMVKTTLDAKGRFTVRVTGSGSTVKAYVLLHGPLLDVKPDRPYSRGERTPGADPDPYALPITLKIGKKGVVQRGVFKDEGPAAAANVWTYLRRASGYAALNSPVQIPPVTAYLRFGDNFDRRADVGVSYYSSKKRSIYLLDDEDTPTVHDEWEPFTILHEYGHHVLFSVAAPWAKSDGDHTFSEAYPDAPALAYSEGLAHAFAAVVLGKTRLGYECQEPVDIGKTPAVPASNPRHLAQYNESASGGVVYKLLERFGLKRLLESLREYKSATGRFPGTMRELREAVVELEGSSAATHVDVDRLFSGQGLRWGTSGKVEVPHNEGRDVFEELKLSITGPYGTCEPADRSGDGTDPSFAEGPALSGYLGQNEPQSRWPTVVQGGLPFTWQDECLMNAADGVINADDPQTTTGALGGEFELPFPSLDVQAQHRGQFTLTARYTCRDKPTPDPPDGKRHTCDAETANIGLSSGVALDNADAPYATTRRTDAFVLLSPNTDVPIVTWGVDGNCKIVQSGEDCSVGKQQPAG